jgi:hypothetical protein
MKKKNKTKTFAQRAQDIIKSFPRAKYDSIEKSALEGAMEKLMIEQEAFRQANNMGQGQQEIQSLAYGGPEDPYKQAGFRPVQKPMSDDLTNAIIYLNNKMYPYTPETSEPVIPTVVPPKQTSPVAPVRSITYGGPPASNGFIESSLFRATNAIPVGSASTGTSSTIPLSSFKSKADPIYFESANPLYSTPNNPQLYQEPIVPPPTPPLPPVNRGTGTVKSANTATAATVASAAAPAPSPADIVKARRTIPELQPGLIRNQYGNIPGYSDYMGATIGNSGFASGVNPPTASLSTPKANVGLETDKLNAKMAANTASVAGKTGGDGTSLLPSYISAGTSLLGNIAQMIFDKRPKPLNLPKYTPEGIDLYNQRLGLRRDADVDRSTMLNQTRNVGMNAGQTISAMNSGTAGLQRNLGRALTESELAEQQYNVGARNRAGEVNAMTGMREGMMNKQMEEMWKQRQSEYLAGATNTIPEFMSDVNRIKYQDKYLKQLSDKDRAMLELLMNSSQNYGGYFTPDGRFVSDIYYKGPKR